MQKLKKISFDKNSARVLQALLKHGCTLFPIKKGRKEPRGFWAKNGSTDLEDLKTWRGKSFNIGVDTGKSNLLVVDFDVKNEPLEDLLSKFQARWPLTKTFAVKTASGGLHLYYQLPEGSELGNTAGSLMKGVDTRGRGGYVVAPGSIVFIDKDEQESFTIDKSFDGEDGVINYRDIDWAAVKKDGAKFGEYLRCNVAIEETVFGEELIVSEHGSSRVAFAPLPKELHDALEELRSSKTQGLACEVDDDAIDTDHTIKRAIDYCENQHPPAIEGESGDSVTFQLFARLRDMGISPDMAVEIAADYYNDRCEPPWDLEDLATKAEHAYQYAKEPIGVMSPHADFAFDNEDMYDPEELVITVPETGQVIRPKADPEMQAKPVEERAVAKTSRKNEHRLSRLTAALSGTSNVNYVYVATDDRIYPLSTREDARPYSTPAFSKLMRVKYRNYCEDMKVTPFEAAEDLGNLMIVDQRGYDPNEPRAYVDNLGDTQRLYWNMYETNPVQPKAGICKAFHNYINHIIPDEEDRKVILDFLAYVVQNPNRIMAYALVLVGRHGIGKTLLGRLMGVMVGNSNFNVVGASDIKSRFNEYLLFKRIILFDEVFDTGTIEINNRLKTYIGAQYLSIEGKGKDPFKYKNYGNFILTSNYKGALKMDAGERRYYVIETNPDAGEDNGETRACAAPMWDIVDNRNADSLDQQSMILHEMLHRDLSGFNPNNLPRRTDAMEQMIARTRRDWQEELDMLMSGDIPEIPVQFDAFAFRPLIKYLKGCGFKVTNAQLIDYIETHHIRDCKVYTQCASSSSKSRETIVVTNPKLFKDLDIKGMKIALADYCHTQSSQITDYIDEDFKHTKLSKFIKARQDGVNVRAIK